MPYIPVIENRFCNQCQREYESRHPTSKYCSLRCKARAVAQARQNRDRLRNLGQDAVDNGNGMTRDGIRVNPTKAILSAMEGLVLADVSQAYYFQGEFPEWEPKNPLVLWQNIPGTKIPTRILRGADIFEQMDMRKAGVIQ